jgi:hypothetical protein
MATTDARPVPIKNQAYRLYFDIRKNDGTLITTWAGQDTELSGDGGAFADATNEATEIGTSGNGYIDLTSGEMNYDAVIVKVTVTNTGALPYTIVINPQEADDIRVSATYWAGGLIPAPAVTGVPKIDLSYILGTLLTETAGQIAAGFKKLFDVAAPVFTLLSINQTGDNYARLGAPASASVSADIAAVKSDTGTLVTRLTSARAGYLDNLNVGGPVASQADITALNQSASRRLILTTVGQYERPETGDVDYTVELRTYGADGDAVNADSTPTLTATGPSGSLSGNLSVASNPATGVYRWTYTVEDSDDLEEIRLDASAIISGSTFTLSAYTQVADFVAATWSTADQDKLIAIYDKLPTNYLMGSSDQSNHDTGIDAILVDTNELQTELADGGRTDLLIDEIKAKTDLMAFAGNDVRATLDGEAVTLASTTHTGAVIPTVSTVTNRVTANVDQIEGADATNTLDARVTAMLQSLGLSDLVTRFLSESPEATLPDPDAPLAAKMDWVFAVATHPTTVDKTTGIHAIQSADGILDVAQRTATDDGTTLTVTAMELPT